MFIINFRATSLQSGQQAAPIRLYQYFWIIKEYECLKQDNPIGDCTESGGIYTKKIHIISGANLKIFFFNRSIIHRIVE
jgi:hypothetical protein